jgi:predicted transcriptional regulator YdeE
LCASELLRKKCQNICSLVGNIVSPAPRRDYDKPDFSGALSQWQEFWSRSHEVKATNNNCYYGLSVVPIRTQQRNNCSGVFQYLAAQEAIDGETVPEGMIKLTIPPQKYAKPQVIGYHGKRG